MSTTPAAAPTPRVVSLALVRRGRGACGWFCCAPWHALLLRRVSGHCTVANASSARLTRRRSCGRRTRRWASPSLRGTLFHVADLVVDGRHVLLYAARRWVGTPAAMEAGTHVRWERVDALDSVQPALPSLCASQGPLVRYLDLYLYLSLSLYRCTVCVRTSVCCVRIALHTNVRPRVFL
jgi:hypothetical protein